MQPTGRSSNNSRTYTKAQFNTFMMASMQQMFRLYQYSNQKNIELKKKISEALKTGQVGGYNKSFSQKNLDNLLYNSLQQMLILYQQSNNKNIQLKNQIAQLHLQRISV